MAKIRRQLRRCSVVLRIVPFQSCISKTIRNIALLCTEGNQIPVLDCMAGWTHVTEARGQALGPTGGSHPNSGEAETTLQRANSAVSSLASLGRSPTRARCSISIRQFSPRSVGAILPRRTSVRPHMWMPPMSPPPRGRACLPRNEPWAMAPTPSNAEDLSMPSASAGLVCAAQLPSSTPFC